MKIDSSQKAFYCFQKWFENDVEEFWIVALNSNLEMIAKKLLFRGTANSCLIHPRDIIRFNCLNNATSFVIAHNHPSGNHRPSQMDILITKRLVFLSRLAEIPMNDHLIITKDRYFSFADSGMLARYQSMRSLSLSSR